MKRKTNTKPSRPAEPKTTLLKEEHKVLFQTKTSSDLSEGIKVALCKIKKLKGESQQEMAEAIAFMYYIKDVRKFENNLQILELNVIEQVAEPV